jgi:serine protease AprX
VAQLGGVVTKDLYVINAFAAELPARAVPELAWADGVRWVSLDAPTTSSQTGAEVVFTTWATSLGATSWNSFSQAALMTDSALGPNGAFGSTARAMGAFSGFAAEVTPGYTISKVEVVLYAYTSAKLNSMATPTLIVSVAGKSDKGVGVDYRAFDQFVGAANAGAVYIDVTSSHIWQWADFDNGVELTVDQRRFWQNNRIYYDAVGLRVTSVPGTDLIVGANPTSLMNAAGDNTTRPQMTATFGTVPTSLPKASIDTSKLLNVYNGVVRATDVWNEPPDYLQGQGVTVAVVDSGAVKNKDLGGRLIASANFNKAYHNSADRYGHGTFVATIIGGDGRHSGSQYIGIAPKTNLLNLRVSDDQGMATESDVVSALQWLYEHKDRYNIRVVNLSLNSSVAQPYGTSPMDAAVEVLWFNGIVVVVSAGNNGAAALYPPANDPFVITVGATDDRGTPNLNDDVVAPFSAYGVTEAGVVKPDLVAPGTRLIAFLSDNRMLTIGKLHPENRVNDYYFRMSGTSMAAPIVSGAVALLLQDEPNLTPDQVKYRLTATANKSWSGYSTTTAGAGYLDIYTAVHAATAESANTGVPASQLLWSGSEPIFWGSVNWNSVNWNSVNWNSVNWNSVNWNSVNWNSDYWGP